MIKQPDFNYQKATQAINYFIRKTPDNKENMMKFIKLIWLADRYHIRKYGRPVIGDKYVAMPLGPVGSGVKDIAEASEFAAKVELIYAKKFIRQVDRYSVESISDVDMDVFSETDIESFEFAYKHFGELDQFSLSKLAHKYPEWNRFEKLLNSKQSTRETMDYLDFFENPNNSSEDKFTMDEKTLLGNKEIFEETLRLQSLL